MFASDCQANDEIRKSHALIWKTATQAHAYKHIVTYQTTNAATLNTAIVKCVYLCVYYFPFIRFKIREPKRAKSNQVKSYDLRQLSSQQKE